jgi:flagellar hook protein FlgE
MFGAIYIGLSGLNAYSRGLQEVSNNVTNLNTSGFKGTNVNFQNYFGAGDTGGSSYTVDSRAAGNGVGLGDSLIDLKQGELRQTDRDLDLAVSGAGFLVLLDGSDVVYARTGNFEVDKDGFIVLSGTKYRLATLEPGSNHPVSLSIEGKRMSQPKATSLIKFADNLSSTATTAYSVSDLKVYNGQGDQQVWKATFTKKTGQNVPAGTWTVTITDGLGASVATAEIGFDIGGNILDASKTVAITRTGGFSMTFDFSGARSFSGGDTSTLRAASVDGYGVGTATTVAVNAKGELEIAYSNEQKLALGAVALADFRDTAGLKQRGGGIFAYEGSGERMLTTSEDPRLGQVMSKRLEASNVDLSKQFGDLILIQRGFQASSQIVSVSNDMIQQLFGIRGQG